MRFFLPLPLALVMTSTAVDGNSVPDWCNYVSQDEWANIPACAEGTADLGTPSYCDNLSDDAKKWIPDCGGSADDGFDLCNTVNENDRKWIPECGDGSDPPDWCSTIPESERKYVNACDTPDTPKSATVKAGLSMTVAGIALIASSFL